MCIFIAGLTGNNIYFDNVSNLEDTTTGNIDLSNAHGRIELYDLIADINWNINENGDKLQQIAWN